MSKKIIGIIIIVTGFLLFVGIIYVFFINSDFLSNFFNKEVEIVEIKNVDPKVIDKATTNSEIRTKEVKVVNINNPVTEDKKTENIVSSLKSSKDDLVRMASSFAERFGSYSNQSDYTNLSHLIIFMSPKMKSWAEKFIQDSRLSKGPSDIYYGITTKSVKEEMLKYNEDTEQAEVLVNTRRKEASASSSNQSNSFSQDLIISFVKVNGVWKVDSAEWQ